MGQSAGFGDLQTDAVGHIVGDEHRQILIHLRQFIEDDRNVAPASQRDGLAPGRAGSLKHEIQTRGQGTEHAQCGFRTKTAIGVDDKIFPGFSVSE